MAWSINSMKDLDDSGIYKKRHYEISGISGDTGGTLTVGAWTKIYNVAVTGETASAVLAALTKRISSNTVVVAYTNPTADHNVHMTVWGW